MTDTKETESEGLKVALDRLKKAAKPNCTKCYGRGWLGFDRITGLLITCKCLKFSRIK